MGGIVQIYVLKILGALLGFLCFYLVLRACGTEALVEYSFYLTLITFFGFFLSFGSNVFVVEGVNSGRSNAFSIEFNRYLVRVIVFLVLVVPFLYIYESYYLLLSIPLGLVSILSSFMMINTRYVTSVFWSDISKWLSLLLVFPFLLSYGEGATVIQLLCASGLVLSLISFGYSLSCMPGVRLRVAKEENFTFDGAYIFLSATLGLAAAQLDRVVFKNFFPSNEFAAYLSVQLVFSVLVMAAISITAYYTKAISNFSEGANFSRQSRLILGGVSLLVLCSIPFVYIYFSILGINVILSSKLYLLLSSFLLVSLLFGVGLSSLQYHKNKRLFLIVMMAVVVLQALVVLLLHKYLGVYSLVVSFGIGMLLSRYLAWQILKRDNIRVAVWEKG